MRWLLALVLLGGCSDAAPATLDATAADGQQPSCDDHNSCTDDRLEGSMCAHDPVPNCCGNGTVDPGEACDDGNQADLDGCSSACRFERALVLGGVEVQPGTVGCDLTGDGQIDNVWGSAGNDAARSFVSNYLSRDFSCSARTTLFVFEGADATMAGSFQLRLLLGVDTEVPFNPRDYFSGHEPFYVTSEITASPLVGAAPAGALTASAAEALFPLASCLEDRDYIPIDFVRLQIGGTLTTTADGPTALDGILCGAMTAPSMHRFPNATGIGGATLLDVTVVGFDSLGFVLHASQPDIDVDNDGLETFQDTDGDLNIDLCTDGNGVQIQGTGCPEDPRIADAFSAAYRLTLMGAQLAGKAP